MEISKRITSNRVPDCEDLLQETIMALINSDQEKINRIIEDKKLTFYIIRILINQYHSKTSPYYMKYKRYYSLLHKVEKKVKENRISDIYIYNRSPLNKEELKKLQQREDRLNWIEEKLIGLNWFDVQVFKIYYKEKYSLNTMARATRINRSTLGKSIRIVKKHLQNEKQNDRTVKHNTR